MKNFIYRCIATILVFDIAIIGIGGIYVVNGFFKILSGRGLDVIFLIASPIYFAFLIWHLYLVCYGSPLNKKNDSNIDKEPDKDER